jgi:tetratricopeptide (TPR) repeat protein/TolB-like protein/predicted Ser/Thr protein kinase
MTGRRLSHYDLVEEISRGGMGVVYRAVDVNLGREVAIKVLPDDILHDSGRRTRLLQEARAASTLEHPHIAVIHEVGEDEGVTFIAMELIRGEKLSDCLQRGPLPLARALTLAIEIAEGLARAHDKAIVHRDLKPANVMVTDEGHAKVIDFGLAKVVERVDSAAATASIGGPRTESGIVLGTAAYMSPEQARGARVDQRSDIFALGVTLYEMLTGRPAFQGQSSLDTMRAVLSQPVPPLPATDTPAEVTAEVQRIITKCTAKDPEERFQGMKDLVVDLRAVRRRLESASSVAVTSVSPSPDATSLPVRRRPRRVVWAAAAVTVLAVAAAALWWAGRTKPSSAAASGKRAVAVLYFENNTGDQTLDWMRTGLTDMLVTDLSQSSDIEVVGTDRVVQILQDMNRADDRVLSADVVQAVADRAQVDQVVLGSYIKAGDTIRISARVQDARTGRIMKAERVEGPGPSAVFALVDELTRRLKATVIPPGAAGARGSLLARPNEPERGLDRGVTEITTSSIEAYRYYAEGLNFHERGLFSQAMPLLERAIQIDPDFAMALAKLAVVHYNLRSFTKSEEYAKHALAHVERLTTRERYYIEGFYYGLRAETRARSIEAYKQELALHPEHQASRHNLALTYGMIERFREGIAEYEELLRRGTSNPTSYENLADFLISIGDMARAHQVAEEFVAKQPENALGYRTLGTTLAADGQLDAARAAYDKSVALDPLSFPARLGQRSIAHLQDRWQDVDAINEEFLKSPNAFQQYLGLIGSAQLAALRGQGRAALGLLERAARVPGNSAAQRANAHNGLGRLLIRRGNAPAALSQAQQALVDSRGLDQEFESLRIMAVAQAGSGRLADSQKTLALLETRAQIVPSERDARRVRWTRGLAALMAGDTATAATDLAGAAEMLPAYGHVIGPPTDHADLWFDASWAHVKAGRDNEAAKWLERLQKGFERLDSPDAYARSFFMLGQIYERRGDSTHAREQYARFLDLWRDGDAEREWVAEAQRKVAGRN